jgi:hypothetical protein
LWNAPRSPHAAEASRWTTFAPHTAGSQTADEMEH